MAKNPVQLKKVKYIDVRYHFLIDNMEDGLIKMVLSNTDYQIADIFTKALGRELFERNESRLGLMRPI